MFKNENELLEWLTDAKANFSAVQAEWQKNRDYYETKQVPPDVPPDIAYVVKNKCLPYVNRLVSKIVGGKVTKTFKSPDKRSLPLEHLFDDVLERNSFYEEKVETVANRFFVEGLGGFKLVYNPFKDGVYGLGFPEIHTPNPLAEELLLDPNSSDGSHQDDRARAMGYEMLLSKAKEKKEWKGKEGILGAAIVSNTAGRMEKVKLYEIEFFQSFYVMSFYDAEKMKYFPLQRFVSAYSDEYREHFSEDHFVGGFVDDEDAISEAVVMLQFARGQAGAHDLTITEQDIKDNVVWIEIDIPFVVVTAGTEGILEYPQKSDYGGFSTAIALHSIRHTDHKLPFSPLLMLTDTQDRINSGASMMHQQSLTATKNLKIVSSRDEDFGKVVRKAGGSNFIHINDPNFKIEDVTDGRISDSLLKQFQLDHAAFDDVSESDDVERGRAVDMSGRAIDLQQRRSDIPLYVPKIHFEACLKELFRRILECIINKMDKPFFIQRKIDGQQTNIYFNFPSNRLPEDDDISEEFNIDINGVINPLQGIKIPDIGIEIEPDKASKEQTDVNKSLAMADRQMLAPIDVLKAVYPNTWSEKFENMTEYNQAAKMVQQIMSLSPGAQEQLMAYIQQQQQADQIIQGRPTR